MSTLTVGPAELAADARFLEALERARATSPALAIPLVASNPLEKFRLARLIRIGRIREAPPKGYYLDLEAADATRHAARVGQAMAVLMLLVFAAMAFFLYRHPTG